MLYKLLGIIVWRVGKRVLRRKVGSAGAVPQAALAGGLVALLVAVAFLVRGRGGRAT